MRSIIVILHNIRSAHNVGAIMRTAEGFGVSQCYITGYTPYPMHDADTRLPHLARKIHANIAKTALGAETALNWTTHANIDELLTSLRASGHLIAGLEQDTASISLDTAAREVPLALLLGEEVAGISPELRAKCDLLLEIPMHGTKESFNVSVAAGIALYELSKA